MTVCVAAICDNYRYLVLASDRMLTAGNIQFQHPGGKTYFLTRSIALMLAGDTVFQGQIATRVARALNQEISAAPEKWIRVEDVAGLWHDTYADEKRKLGEAAYLRPLGLTSETFIQNQKRLLPEVVQRVTEALQFGINMPPSEAIIAGRDEEGIHIFSTSGQEVRRDTTVGFAAIGSGAYHADSFLALWPYGQNLPTALATWLLYAAKRRAEIDAFVGSETDIHIIGPDLGVNLQLPSKFLADLARSYDELRKTETDLITNAAAFGAKSLTDLMVAETQEAVEQGQKQVQEGQPATPTEPLAVDAKSDGH